MIPQIIMCVLFHLASMVTGTRLSVQFIISQVPPCARACELSTLKEVPLRDDHDVYGLCNKPEFTRAAGQCELKNCDAVSLQKTTALVSTYCASVGGALQNFSSFRFPDGPPCANNCISFALVTSGCGNPGNATCSCKSPEFINSYPPCTSQTCSPAEIAAVRADLIATCAPVGGIGPFARSQIQGYLDFVLPNSFPPIPIVNESTPATPSGTPVPHKPPQYYRKGHYGKDGNSKVDKGGKYY